MEETTCNISWILSQEPMMLPFSLPPPRANQPIGDPGLHTRATNTQQRKSARLADKAKNNVGLGSLQLAQQVLVKKLGELIPDSQNNSNCNFDSFVKQLPRPFNKTTMEAMQVLLEEATRPRARRSPRWLRRPPWTSLCRRCRSTTTPVTWATIPQAVFLRLKCYVSDFGIYLDL
jgi:hypothetical protein